MHKNKGIFRIGNRKAGRGRALCHDHRKTTLYFPPNGYIYNMFRQFFIGSFAAMLCIHVAYGQSAKTDSIRRLITGADADTSRIKMLIELSAQFNREAAYDSAIKYGEEAVRLCERIQYKTGLLIAHIRLGITWYNKGDYSRALANYVNASLICEQTGDKARLATCYNNIGNVYKKQGQFDLSLENHFKSLEIRKATSDSAGMSASYTNIGVLYRMQKKLDEAVKYNLLALEIDKRLGDKKGVAMDYGNLGNIYRDLGSTKMALDNFMNSLAVFKEMQDVIGMTKATNNIGEVYANNGDHQKALSYYQESLSLARQAGAKDLIYSCYLNMSNSYAQTRNMDLAYRYQVMLRDIYDSIMDEEKNREMAELQVKFNTREKEKEIQLLTKDKLLDAARIRQQRILNYSVMAGLALALLLAFFIYRGYRDKQRANAELSEKNAIIEQKNRDTTDSITYAQRIQSSILPSAQAIEKLCPGSFVLYLPKDIVSGDFYYFCRKGDYIYIAAADCTGHGVPGALMSMIGLNQLHEIIEVRDFTGTAEILEELHKRVLLLLNADISNRNSKDGMDVALLRIDRRNHSAQFSGAVRPLYRADAAGLTVFKGDRYSIAGVKEVGGTPFSVHEIPAPPGTMFYLFSDGYADQFSERTGKKFMVKRLQELLASVHRKEAGEQQRLIGAAFDDWKGACPQVDDVLVIGVRV